MSVVFLILYLLVFLVLPMWVAARMAANRGRPMWLGLVLGFLLSWLGVLITWLIVKNDATRTAAV